MSGKIKIVNRFEEVINYFFSQTLMVSDAYPTEGVSAATAALMSQAPPPQFCSIVVRLIALQILNTEVCER